MDENCIVVKHVTKSYGGRKVVDDLSFEVKKGEVFGLLGHNGAGKSTTIEMILGLKKPDSGKLTICKGANATLPVERQFKCWEALLPGRSMSGQ